MTLYNIQTLLNSEGDILSILKNDSNKLFAMGNTNKGLSKILCKTNQFIIELYLNSRITLKQLFLLSQDKHYIIKTENEAKEIFFEITTEHMPAEITGISCGNDLYGLLSDNMKSRLTINEIMDLLPNPISDETPVEIENLKLDEGQVSFFGNDTMEIVTVDSELINSDEHDYIKATTLNGSEILARINPSSLQLFFSNQISTKELFLCRQHEDYIIIEGNSIRISKFNDDVVKILKFLHYSDLSYFSLPKKIQIENPIKRWKDYANNYTISGKGVLESGFSREHLVELEIITRR